MMVLSTMQLGVIKMEKRIVKVGLSKLDKPMTYKQALNYGNKNMPEDLKKAGFICTICVSDSIIHDDLFYRVNYTKIN